MCFFVGIVSTVRLRRLEEVPSCESGVVCAALFGLSWVTTVKV